MSWGYFDKFYCISVKERKDRKKSAERQFSRIGLSGKVEFLLVDRHPANSEQGIYESHLACLKKGIQAGAQTIVIFEDDVIFDRFNEKALEQSIDFLSENSSWQILYFGCLIKKSKKTGNPSVVKIKYRSLTHGFAINRHFAEMLAEQPWQGIPIDDFLALHTDNAYSVYPAFAFQSNSPSDNANRMSLDTFRRFWGGLEQIQKRNEFYHRHRPLIIAAHAVIIIFIIMLFYF